MQAILSRSTAVDWFERLFCCALFVRMAFVFGPSLSDHPINILPLLAEGLIVAFVLVRRSATNMTMRPLDWVIALGGSSLPLLARPLAPGASALAPAWIIALLFLLGTGFGVWGKCALNRRFGVAAANRGVMVGGPYVFVRHPIYAGYCLTYVGSFLANPMTTNASIYVASIVLFGFRIQAEERVLSVDAVYRAFMTRVRYRLVPHLY